MDAFATIGLFRRQALLALCLLLGFPGNAQEPNPFELLPRLDLPPAQEAPLAIADTGNPFDLVAPSSPAAAARADSPKPTPQAARQRTTKAADAEEVLQRILLIAVMGSLLLFTILLTLLRSFFGYAYKAFLNDNLLSQLQRKNEGGGATPYYLFYSWFLFNAGLFVFLLSRYYGQSYGLGGWLDLAVSIGLATGLILAKHLVLNLLAEVFPIKKEVRLYSFTIVIFGIMLGVFLLLANMLIAYGPESYTQGIVYVAYAGITALYLFRAFRGAFIGKQFLFSHLFHFLLYICAVEIAPVLVLAKLIKGYAGS